DKEEPKHYDFYGYIYYSVTSSHKIVKFDEASLEVLNLKANKAEAAALLQKEYNWEPVRVKHGESIWTRFYQCHILPTRFGIDKRKAHFSNFILSGVMTRDEALAELSKPIYLDDLENDKKIIFKRFGISAAKFDELMHVPKKVQSDFKTEKALKETYAKIRKVLPLKGLLKVSTRH
ncbi:MAG: hypothetical protein GQ574_26135, partial [Crocinitomix sp.]|nr:hypothetical protein [Crocinitomix sp.]